MVVFVAIFFLLLLAYTWLINFYHRSWQRLPVFVPHVSTGSSSFPDYLNNHEPDLYISVVIAVRNEEDHIERLLSALLSQKYQGAFEIVCIDDHSDDSTWQKLSLTASNETRIRILRLPEGITGKKKCIEMGVQHSLGTHIVTTDADCHVPPYWLSTIAAFFSQRRAKFIAGPVKMSGPSTLTGIFQRLDFLTMQGITGASVSTRLHAMCNGANLAYEKAVFEEVGGFEGIDHIPSGDDMLLMYKILSKYPSNVFYLKNKDAIVVTPTEPDWSRFFSQRIRWASKATHYHDKKIIYVLVLTYLVNVSFLISAGLLFFEVETWWIFSLFLLMKIVVEFPFVSDVAAFFDQRRLMVYFPLLQPLHIVYIIVSGWLGRFGSYQWKSRIIKNKGRTNPAKQ